MFYPISQFHNHITVFHNSKTREPKTPNQQVKKNLLKLRRKNHSKKEEYKEKYLYCKPTCGRFHPFYFAGKCEFGDELCWFFHCENSEETVIKEIKFNACENVFDNMNNFMQQNKREKWTKLHTE